MRIKTPPTKTTLKKALIYEMRNGQPIYYKNYKQVLKGTLTIEQVMAISGLHAKLIAIIFSFLHTHLPKEQFEILLQEIGFQWSKHQWRSLDIAIFEKAKVVPYLTSKHYIPIAPLIAIEIDTKADFRRLSFLAKLYVRKSSGFT